MRRTAIALSLLMSTACGGGAPEAPREDTSYKSITASICEIEVEDQVGHSVDFPFMMDAVQRTNEPNTYRLESHFETMLKGTPIRIDFVCVVEGLGDDLATYRLKSLHAVI